MATDITMPKLSDTMTEGRLISWKKSVGDPVARGEIIAEVETDKATMELESFSSGVLLEVRVKAGDMVAVGTVIGVVGAPEEKVPERAVAAKTPSVTPAPVPTPEVTPVAVAAGHASPAAAEAHEKLPSAGGTAMDKASPHVRLLAREQGVDLHDVPGSGPEGRILQEDLERYLSRSGAVTDGGAATVETAGTGTMAPAGAEQPLSRMRAAIARTVTEAWRTIPHFSVTVAVEMVEAERVRQELTGTGVKVSVNDLIVKAAALALALHPQLNSSFAGDRIITHDDVNLGIAVSVAEGLYVPVITGCQGLSLKEIAAVSRALVDRVRAGKVRETDLSGGTFSVSNLGMFGVEEFTAVIYPPQGAILAVGAILDRTVIRGGVPVAGRVMKMTLSADHRLVDGVMAARFLAELKLVLENPVTLLV